MKLSQIFNEMAWATGSPHPEFSPEMIEQTKQWFLTKSSATTPIEGGKFTIVQKSGSYGLVRARDQELLGWVLLDQKKRLFQQFVYPLVNIQILPRYRNTIAILVLINAIRSIADHPIYVDDPIFQDGQSLLNAISKRGGIAKVFTVDKKTGTKTPYSSTDLNLESDVGILLEQSFIKLSHRDVFPGGSREVVLELFAGYTSELE